MLFGQFQDNSLTVCLFLGKEFCRVVITKENSSLEIDQKHSKGNFQNFLQN